MLNFIFKKGSIINFLICLCCTIVYATKNNLELPDNLDSIVAPLFDGIDGAMVIYDLQGHKYSRYNADRCARRFSPKSTFKIPHALIALETGVLADANSIIAWDSTKHPRQDSWKTLNFDWARDHNLRSAMQHSVVWYFQEVATRIGRERMQEYLHKISYGNGDISGELNAFWLTNTLKISAVEQVDLLRKFYNEQLGFSRRSTDIVKDILLKEIEPQYKLSAKTGGGQLENGNFIGWYVGYVEQKDNVYFFALNIEAENYRAIKDRRIELTRQVLMKLAII